MQIEFPWSETHEMNLQIQALTSGNACRRSYSVLPSRFGGSLDELRFLYVTYMDKQWKKRNATWHLTLVSSHLIVITSSPHHLIIPSPKLIPVTQESAQQSTLEAFSYPDLFVSLYLCTWHQQHSVVSHEAIESPTALCAKKPDRTCGTASLIHRRLPTRRVNVMPLY